VGSIAWKLFRWVEGSVRRVLRELLSVRKDKITVFWGKVRSVCKEYIFATPNDYLLLGFLLTRVACGSVPSGT
jgi:hypothetical protein